MIRASSKPASHAADRLITRADRKPLLRRSELRPKPIDTVTGEKRWSSFKRPNVATVGSLARSTLKRKPRRAKPGDEPLYKAFIKTLPCVVGGKRCRRADPHHLIDGKGDARKGMGQTAPDRFLLPLCRAHHNQFHDRVGFCRGWDDAQRLTFQEQECERLRAIWADLNELGVTQEPAALAI